MSDEFEQHAVLGTFMPLRLQMRLGGSREEHDEPSVGTMATVVHEHLHWFQTLFTGYGQIAWDAHRQLTAFLTSEWDRLSGLLGGKRRLPLAHLARADVRAISPTQVVLRTVFDQLRVAQARHRLTVPDVRLDALGIITIAGYAANPKIEVASREHSLQVNDVLEGHAMFVEVTYLKSELGVSEEEAIDRDSRPERYLIAYDWFVEQCGKTRADDFPFVCDLALQTSWRPVVPTTEKEWQDSHPAFRFVGLVKVLKDRPELTLGIDGQAPSPSAYRAFASELLSAAGFVSLEEILKERIEAQTRKKALLELERLMVAGLEYRIANPECAGNPALDLDVQKELFRRFPVPIAQVEGGFGAFGNTDQKVAQELVMELHFQAFAAQIFGDFTNIAKQQGLLECGFGKYEIDGCEYQNSLGCLGRYRPDTGPPIQPTIGQDNIVTGCSFEMLFKTRGFSSSDIDFDPDATMPTEEELLTLANGKET